ncbi:hypothetical protein DYQ86_03600 [Acidobacteria bacterium AB60]|nr:hypothetical protein DYQ86_03600 [Acidobacteria bacterium AB60]
MRAVLASLGLVLALSVARPASAADVSGTWKGAFDFNGNSVPLVLNLKLAGADVTGTVEGLPTTPAEIHDGKVEGDSVTFWVNSDYQGQTYKLAYKGKISPDRIDFEFGTEDGSWGTTMTVTRDGAATPAASPGSTPAAAPAAADVTGVWKGNFDMNGTALPITFNLKSAGAAVTGTAEGMGAAPIEIHDGKLSGDLLTFWLNADYQGQTYQLNYKGKVTPGQIDFDFGTADGGWSANLSVKK